ncbi:MAG: site-specific DNA-methyltransferase [Candidatus Coatesbacteria bacterium]|nr:site-specific DNA-methyltransferase [Candidatus Coatesbacteria bacterium]
MFKNRLNDLSPKEWIKFQKSWFELSPARREKDVLVHPAKFPEELVCEFVRFFTKSGQTVLDPMAGTGSTLLACIWTGRAGYGIELNRSYAAIARARVAEALRAARQVEQVGPAREAVIIEGDARRLLEFELPEIDYCITSPPYWDMLRQKGAQTQRKRAEAELDVFYSSDESDLGNIAEYSRFIDEVVDIFIKVRSLMRDRAYLTVIVKNVKKKGKVYPLAWDLGKRLGEIFALKDERIWCQGDQRLAPYGIGSAWVSNTFHHYCLNFRKE